ncbi:MAG TPA: hypothetical protein VFY06_01880 [Verrucomicrobiae bacterium]|nr:hypothetical protein [Verrucomicrobiae bacterium]
MTAALCLSFALNLRAQSNAPVRLAIVPETGEVGTAADMLTAEFSKNNNVQLLERAEIERVYREQGLSAANRDDLKLGRLLGADGLLLMGTSSEGTNQFLNVRLVAVKPGVVLVTESFPWPMKNLTEWSSAFERHLDRSLPKLAVLAKDAIPISVVNLRSAIQSDAGKETEAQLKLLTIQRLSREPQLFVLERQKMQMLTGEKELKSDESAFWDGSYLLEGTVDQKGYSAATVTINGRLTPPKGGAPIQFEVSGIRTNLAEVVNQLAAKVDEALKVNSSVTVWNAADEAEQYFKEAQWAMKWGLYSEAQAAAESAWALGRRNSETATLRIRAYSLSVPLMQMHIFVQDPENTFTKEIVKFAVPDASQFMPLNRAMELYSQDARYILDGTNGPSGKELTMGLQLLRRTSSLLESYNYAVEMRTGHEEELREMREKMRQMLTVLDEHLASSTNQFPPWNDPRENIKWLKWEEGSLCFDQPEAALPMFRQVVQSGYFPDDPPRFVVWSWENRKRTPRLTRQFVTEICSDTNPAVRLEGLYLAIMLTPNDGSGRLEKSEQELLSAMWENRQWLYSSGEITSQLDRFKKVLRAKYGNVYQGNLYLDANAYFHHEPFDSFKQKLLMDFLARASASNLPAIRALFPSTTEQLETPAQASELLPLLAGYQQKYQLAPTLNSAIQRLRQVAGIPNNEPEPAKEALPAQKVLEAKFVQWNLQRPGMDAKGITDFRRMIFRNGRLWLRVAYVAPGHLAEFHLGLPADFQTTYLAVDPQKGVNEEIPFPDKFGVTDDAFEVSADALFVNAQGHLYRFGFQDRTWEEIPAPLESSSQFVWLKDRLYVSRRDGLLCVNPDTKTVEVLVSSRRQPALNTIDPLWHDGTWIYGRSDGKLGALSQDHCFSFDPDTRQWGVRKLPLSGADNYFSMWRFYTSADGALEFLTGPVAHRYLIAYWNDNRPPESLLKESTSFNVKDPASEQRLQPVRWDWPKDFPLEPSGIVTEDQKLWAICPRRIWDHFSPAAGEPVKFSDDRQATLFYFEPGSRRPLSVPVRFEDIDQAVVIKPRINDQPADSLSPAGGGYMDSWESIGRHIGNVVFWLKTPDGLVFGAPNYCGHWLIPNSALETLLKPQGQALNQQVPTPPTVSANPAKP